MPVPSEVIFPSACHPAAVLAYVGIGPGQEFIPYFFGLLGLVGTAVVAVLQWPLVALMRFLSRARRAPERRAEAEGREPAASK